MVLVIIPGYIVGITGHLKMSKIMSGKKTFNQTQISAPDLVWDMVSCTSAQFFTSVLLGFICFDIKKMFGVVMTKLKKMIKSKNNMSQHVTDC